MTPPLNDLSRALTLHQAGKLDEAKRIYDRILLRQPRNADALHLLGALLITKGESSRGIELIGRAIGARPVFPAAQFNLGNALHSLGRLPEAEAAFKKAIQADPRFADAWCNLGGVQKLLGKPLQAEASFREALALRPEYTEVHHNLGQVLRALGRPLESIQALERSLSLRPAQSAVLVDLGSVLEDLGRSAEAEDAYRRAVAVDPRCTRAFCALGNLHRSAGRTPEALAAWKAALAADPHAMDALNNLGVVLNEQGRFDEALGHLDKACTAYPSAADAHSNRGVSLQGLNRVEEAIEALRRAVALKPDFADAWGNLANALVASNRLDEAFEAYDTALALNPDRALMRKNAAMARLASGDFERGWADYEARWEAYPAGIAPALSCPLWRGDAALAGQSILVHAEQGLGDTLMFVRYVPELAARGASVFVEVQPALHSLLQGLPGAAKVLSKGEPLPEAALHIPLLSLPAAFGTRLESIPGPGRCVSPDPVRVEAWRHRLHAPGSGPALNVGLVWRGNPQHTNDRNRSMGLGEWEGLLATPGCRFVNLQREMPEHERAALLSRSASVADWSSEFTDFSATAALVGALDLIIAVDTSVAHLAAAMGRPTWILLPFAPDWRWLLKRSDSPWYPSARLFRQPAIGAWGPVLQTAGSALEELARQSVQPAS